MPITWYSFSPDLRINIVQDDLAIPPAEQIKAEKIWRSAAGGDHTALFNGQLFSVQDITQKTITVRPTEFKYFYAQVSDSRPSTSQRVFPLACSGVATCVDGIIFAQRSAHVTLDKGLWELAPSGTFDSSCIVNGASLSSTILIETELHEELGIPHCKIISQSLKGGISNQETGALDLVIEIQLDVSHSDIETCFLNRDSKEYNNLRVVPRSEIHQFVQDSAEKLSHSSLVILKALSII